MRYANAKNITSILIIGFSVLLLSGCLSDEEKTPIALPEVNDENCKRAFIITISPKERREEFADKCAGRGVFKPAPLSER